MTPPSEDLSTKADSVMNVNALENTQFANEVAESQDIPDPLPQKAAKTQLDETDDSRRSDSGSDDPEAVALLRRKLVEANPSTAGAINSGLGKFIATLRGHRAYLTIVAVVLVSIAGVFTLGVLRTNAAEEMTEQRTIIAFLIEQARNQSRLICDLQARLADHKSQTTADAASADTKLRAHSDDISALRNVTTQHTVQIADTASGLAKEITERRAVTSQLMVELANEAAKTAAVNETATENRQMIRRVQSLIDAFMKDMHDATQRLLRSEMALFALTAQHNETTAHFEKVTAEMKAEFVAQLEILQQQVNKLKPGTYPTDNKRRHSFHHDVPCSFIFSQSLLFFYNTAPSVCEQGSTF
eukprot:TRINITY_DN542_c0_g1_i1.p1 TRINITY_DN542_c0_g1~~TRINITY_DN542_c0_g1_i1.p1  ORF type:complete len:358 (-),score=84.16 TRINITY_DN542_c0_g1_i1:24-1097(-)